MGTSDVLTALAFGLAVAPIFCELLAAGYLFVLTGRLVWRNGVGGEAKLAATIQALPTEGHRLRLHPYFGYTALPGMRLADVTKTEDIRNHFGEAFTTEIYPHLAANSHGLWALHDYPYRSDPKDTFIVGVFGGSVALQFGLTIEKELGGLLADHPAVAGKRVVLLTFANGGGKQPMQVTALAYFLSLGQRFDYIVNLDGLNELFIGWYNVHEYAAPADMPFVRFVLGIQNIAFSAQQDIVANLGAIRQRLATSEAAAVSTRLGLSHLVQKYRAERARGDLEAIQNALSKIDPKDTHHLAMQVPQAGPNSKATLVADTADIWQRASTSMYGLARSAGTPYLHVLQPNQYFANDRFTQEERKKYLNLEFPPVAEIVPAVYSAYLARAEKLTSSGVDFLDATRIYDGRGAFWYDHIGHINEEGNRILARMVAARMRDGLTCAK